ncbi:sulfurtransferase [Shinella sp. BYT-45]|uniref:sulfurtransferase n=1 Tax=Shinella sp. BYT-45 TaxID=3377377 RepID=UPI0039810CE9
MGNTILPEHPLVDAGWLRRHRDDVILLDASVERREGPEGTTLFGRGHGIFAKAHIPGARFADLFDGFSDPEAPFAFTVPRPEQIEAAARAAGIDNDSDVVVYDQLGDAWAARIWFVLRAYGFERVRVLGGGLAAWQAAGGEVETGAAAPVSAGSFRAAPRRDWFVDTATVRRIAEAPPDPQRPLISGLREASFRKAHIPGSLSLPYPDLRDAAGTIHPDRVRTLLGDLGVPTTSRPVLYCGGGINAAGLALALTAAGMSGLKIYDDSMNGWLSEPGLPVSEGEGHRFPHDKT